MLGYYDLKRRRQGDVFEIKKESELSEKWMRPVDAEAPKAKKAPAKEKAAKSVLPEDAI
jgi:hypothetical protein